MCNPNLRKDSLQTSTVGLPLSTVLFSLGLCPANFNCLNSDLSAQRTAALFWAVSCSWSILSSTLLFLCLDLSSLPHNLEMSPGRWLGSSWISPHVFPSLSLGVTVFCPWFNTRKSQGKQWKGSRYGEYIHLPSCFSYDNSIRDKSFYSEGTF